MAATFRITRALLRGQFASADCFEKWLEAQTDAQLVTLREDPGIPPGGVSDARYYLWRQDAPIGDAYAKAYEKCDAALITHGGKSGWDTQAAAQAVIDAKLGQGAVIAAEVKKANEKAVSPGNIAAGVAKDVAADAGKALEGATGISAGIIGPVAGVVALGLGGWALWQLLKSASSSGRR